MHVDHNVLDRFTEWADDKYGDDENGRVKINKGHCHNYLGMILDYLYAGEVLIDMKYYIQNMIDDFETDYTKFSSKVQATTPHTAALFTFNNSPVLKDKQAQDFHTYIARALFLCKCA